jgi:hypothetical protein
VLILSTALSVGSFPGLFFPLVLLILDRGSSPVDRLWRVGNELRGNPSDWGARCLGQKRKQHFQRKAYDRSEEDAPKPDRAESECDVPADQSAQEHRDTENDA